MKTSVFLAASVEQKTMETFCLLNNETNKDFKNFFCFTFDKQIPLGKLMFFCIHYISKTKQNLAKKNRQDIV